MPWQIPLPPVFYQILLFSLFFLPPLFFFLEKKQTKMLFRKVLLSLTSNIVYLRLRGILNSEKDQNIMMKEPDNLK